MNKTQFKQLKRRLDKILERAIEEAMDEGVDITTPRFRTILKQIKRKLIIKEGLTLSEYEKMEDKDITEDIKDDIGKKVNQLTEKIDTDKNETQDILKETKDELKVLLKELKKNKKRVERKIKKVRKYLKKEKTARKKAVKKNKVRIENELSKSEKYFNKQIKAIKQKVGKIDGLESNVFDKIEEIQEQVQIEPDKEIRKQFSQEEKEEIKKLLARDWFETIQKQIHDITPRLWRGAIAGVNKKIANILAGKKDMTGYTLLKATKLEIDDTSTYIDKDATGNMTLTDAIIGTRTLKQLGCPVYKFIKATSQSEGDLHLSDATNWAISKAILKVVRVVTSSTDWDLYVLQNDNGYSVDDANIPKIKVMEAGNGNANVYLDMPYEDEDISDEVHLYYVDNSGTNTADIYIIGYELV